MKLGDKVKLIISPCDKYPNLYNDGPNEYFKLGTIYTVQSYGEFESDLYPGVKLVSVEGTSFPVNCLKLI